jgi:hypothetical protein
MAYDLSPEILIGTIFASREDRHFSFKSPAVIDVRENLAGFGF